MATIARTSKAGGGTNFNSGQTIDPDEVNTDFNTVYTEINGNLDDGNIETATIPGAKSLRFTEISAPSSPSSNDILLYAKDSAGTTRLYTKDSAGNESAIVVDSAISLPRSYLAGLGTVQAADADHDITIAVGACRDSTNAADLTLASAITKRLDATWAVGDTNGGLDTGAAANATWYYIWLIKRSDTAVVDALFSTSATAPTMPTSYDYKRRIGAFLTDGSAAIIDYVQTGDRWEWVTPILDVSNDGTEAATTRTLSVPRIAGIVANVSVSADFSTANQGVYLSPLSITDAAPSLTATPLMTMSGDNSSNVSAHGPYDVLTNGSGQIRSRTTGTLENNNLNILTNGWLDRRGRDD